MINLEVPEPGQLSAVCKSVTYDRYAGKGGSALNYFPFHDMLCKVKGKRFFLSRSLFFDIILVTADTSTLSLEMTTCTGTPALKLKCRPYVR